VVLDTALVGYTTAPSAPYEVGDELVTTTCVESVRALAGNVLLGVRCEVVDIRCEPVLTTSATLVVRGEG